MSSSRFREKNDARHANPSLGAADSHSVPGPTVPHAGLLQQKARTMSDAHKSLARRYLEEIWNDGNMAAVDELIDDEYYHRANQIPDFEGPEALKELVAELAEAFPDGRFSVEETVAEGDTVVQRWTFRGTHEGTWFGVEPTGAEVEVGGTATHHFKGGRIVEHLADWDAMGMLQQLGGFHR
jgi:steroid delta-isomerase-like uncharacterized protein